ncbi:uncharacterized protein PFL1_03875 [Pseudozyma flocculosa PF-1]|uniref:Related to Endothelin-converting enzyme 1 n=2 Tax=Pseudozyma flocculosa TaxID=84751 RepID=A0A5C3EZB9_9BASI|nr:uncharacterized protein PFL1_03875 [Pseudozyma flocculosa PF-1]EPQ28571.1 hypothetical protein PFL1_03875 [Pseudozyma flocculosa PF-1]SPO36509.1 related to Endothelin-converting enzyme 1 [Pseudozyma flocculosa]
MATNNQYGRPSTDDYAEDRPLMDHDHGSGHEAQRRPRAPPSLGQRLRRQLNDIFAPLAKPHELRPLERFLIALAAIFLLLAAVFIGLFAGSQHRLSHRPSAPAPRPAPGNPHHDPPTGEVCTSKECVIAASEVLRGIDESVDPCDDFYSFATGGWAKSHPIPGDAGAFGTFQYVAQENAKIIKQILDDAASPKLLDSHPDDEQAKADRHSLAKLKGYYDSCIDTKAQDKLGAKPLLDVVHELKARLGFADEAAADELDLAAAQEPESPLFTLQATSGKPIPPNQPPSRSPKPHPPRDSPKPLPPSGRRQRGLTRALAWAHSRGLPALFEISMDGDAVKDPKAATPYLFPSGLGLPDRAYYDDDAVLDFYRGVVEQAFRALDKEGKHGKDVHADKKGGKGRAPSPDFGQLAGQVVEFERQIARITPDIEDIYDPIGSYNPVNTSSLSYSFQSIDWPSYISALTVRTPKTFILTSPKFLTSLDSLVSRTRSSVLEAYFVWTAARELGSALGPNVALRGPAERLSRYLRGVDADAKEDRDKVCLQDLDEALGFMSGRFFVQKAFGGDSRDRVEAIIRSVIAAFKSRLPDLDWLDDKTRAKAEEKADAIRVMVGYPKSPNTTDAVAVRRFYDDLEVDGADYFGNRLRSSARKVRRDWAQANRQLDPERWDMTPSLVNAEYSPQGNYILFPAGIMQPPYFHVSWPSYLQRGSFGAVAGHELSHAFDPDGRLYDKDGYLRDWWSEETAKEFQQRQSCLARQYARYTVPDGKGGQLHLKSNFTKGEDVADAGGLAQSYRAWRDELARGGADVERANALLPGLGYTREQLFFIAYGLSWSQNSRDSELVRRLRTDPHSPTRYRVNGVVVNNPDFREAFGCRPGKDKMAKKPEDVCSIW